MNMAKIMLKIIVNKVIIKCINIIVMMVLNMKSEDDGIEYYMY